MPLTGPQSLLWPFAIKSLEMHGSESPVSKDESKHVGAVFFSCELWHGKEDMVMKVEHTCQKHSKSCLMLFIPQHFLYMLLVPGSNHL